MDRARRLNAGPTLLAFDFDGTLAPIGDEPAAVRLPRAARVLLSHAAETEGVAVALISGRDADDLAGRSGIAGAYIVGSHGLEIRAPGGAPMRDSPRAEIELEPSLRELVLSSGLRLERKKHALALHWRGVAESVASPLASRFRRWAGKSGLELIEGRCVAEARSPGGGKEEALRWLAEATGAWRVFYAGDDLTDFPALRFASGRGHAVFMASAERIPPAGVTVVSSFRQLFRIVRDEVGV